MNTPDKRGALVLLRRWATRPCRWLRVSELRSSAAWHQAQSPSYAADLLAAIERSGRR